MAKNRNQRVSVVKAFIAGVTAFTCVIFLNAFLPYSSFPHAPQFINGIGKEFRVGQLVLTEAGSEDLDAEQSWQQQFRSGLLIAVLSARENFQKRMDIRNTWGKDAANVIFFVGNSDCEIPTKYRTIKWDCELKKGVTLPKLEEEQHKETLRSIQAKLSRESSLYKDIIVLNMTDSYRTLPYKVLQIYSFAIEQNNLKWILKVDDDMFVWVKRLENRLIKDYSRANMTVLGTIARNWRVHRKGKWAETLYPKSRYPKFAIGQSGHIVTKDVAKLLVEYNGTVHQGEDVSIGIWIEELSTSNETLEFNLVNSPFMTAEGDCSVRGGYLVIGHRMGYKNFVKCLSGSSVDSGSLNS